MLLTYKYIAKEGLFEQLLHITCEEADECVALLQPAYEAAKVAHPNFNELRNGMFVAADFVVWLFSFSAVYRNLSVMSTILGLQPMQVKRKIEWAARALSSALHQRYINFKGYEEMKKDAEMSGFGRNAELEYLSGVPVFIIDGTGIATFN